MLIFLRSEKDILAQFKTNVFGVFRVTKGAIPTFRTRRAGTIVNISSTSGISGLAAYSAYAATKFAIEGASEALSSELAPFNIRLLVIEPGAFRTNFENAVMEPEGGIPEAYLGTPADDIRKRLSTIGGKQPGDPNKAANTIVEAVTKANASKDVQRVLRLPLGKDGVIRANTKINTFKENVDKVKHISESVVFPDH